MWMFSRKGNNINLLFQKYGIAKVCYVLRLDGIFPHLPANLWAFVSDGWTKNDLVYEWYPSQPVQIPRNLTLPGGFNLGKTGNDSCDVITATGPLSYRSFNIYICKEQSSNYPGILCPFLRENFLAEFIRKVFSMLHRWNQLYKESH